MSETEKDIETVACRMVGMNEQHALEAWTNLLHLARLGDAVEANHHRLVYAVRKAYFALKDSKELDYRASCECAIGWIETVKDLLDSATPAEALAALTHKEDGNG
jgi:hypothetical protein